ncbi:uncharacterized protein LOC110464352 [Mizuhopecten yessoensis]|uniref:Myb/SANT-like DNA-binding domain-containing protein n=1 Tax=Mizuhopecten yessoensis TaxID=6573 RepID=A0A210PU65_MIZYE|nr:uncharacterized protein LOC110464352 [Mizuhopecten yessoensis]OWF39984.1 hypothetical protein KP79_PYT19671 [Mizuhopecten yessoensis]
METYRRSFIRHQLSKRLSSTMYSGIGSIGDYRPATNNGVRQTNMQHGLGYQMRKSRGINWTHEEKVFLVRLCAAKARIIEEKKSDSNTLRMKAACWKVIYDQFSARFGRKRTLVRIKEQWKRMKLATRAEQRDREQEVMESPGNESSNTQETVPTKYYGESAEIIAQVKNILGQVANSSFNLVPVSRTEMCTGETDAVADALVRYPDIVTGELPSDGRHSTPEPEPMVIKIEIDDEEDDVYSDDHSQNRNPNSTPEPDIGVIDFNSLEEIVGPERHGNSEPNPGHDHTQASGYDLSTDDIAQKRFSIDFASDTRRSTPEVHMPSYDPGQSSEQWGFFRKSKTNSHKSDLQEDANNSRSVVDDTVLEYARIEHEKKMEYLKKEHEMKLDILKLERETARAKLRKANFKLSLSGANLPS